MIILFILLLRYQDNTIFWLKERNMIIFYDFSFIFASGFAQKNFDEWSDIIL